MIYIAALTLAIVALPCMATADAPAERARVQAHIGGALELLASRDVSELSLEQRSHRAELVARLQAYAAAGRFPRNLDFPGELQPYFVDDRGVHCAMADLIAYSGGESLVARVRDTANNAYVRDLASDAEFLAWLDAHGLSVAEAARIQPTYQWEAPCIPTFHAICGAAGERDVALVGTRIEAPDGNILPMVRLDASYGASAPIAEQTWFYTAMEWGRVGLPAPGWVVSLGQRVVVFADSSSDLSVFGYPYVDAFALRLDDDDMVDVRVPYYFSLPDRPGYLAPTFRVELSSLINALTSEDCVAALEALDPQWTSEAHCALDESEWTPAGEPYWPITTPPGDPDAGSSANVDAGASGDAGSPRSGNGGLISCTAAPPGSSWPSLPWAMAALAFALFARRAVRFGRR